jgi:hypothetical protein
MRKLRRHSSLERNGLGWDPGLEGSADSEWRGVVLTFALSLCSSSSATRTSLSFSPIIAAAVTELAFAVPLIGDMRDPTEVDRTTSRTQFLRLPLVVHRLGGAKWALVWDRILSVTGARAVMYFSTYPNLELHISEGKAREGPPFFKRV